MSQPILACVHRPNSSTGLVGQSLQHRAIHLKCLLMDDSAKPCLDDYRALIIFGGPQSANDPSMRTEHHLVETALAKNVPLLGICLGAQIITCVLGGTVANHKENNVEAGFYEIIPTQKGKNIFSKPLTAYQWHRQGMTLPASVSVLARNNTFPIQAFQAGSKAYGFQFHPEVDFAMMRLWIHRDQKEENRLKQTNAKARWRHYPDYLFHHRQIKSWLEKFLDQWLEE